MNIRQLKDIIAARFMVAADVFSGVVIFIMAVVLYLRSKPILDLKSPGELLLGTSWLPSQGYFGFYQFILGTLYVTLLAMVFAIPLIILSAIYLAEYAHENVREK